MSDAVYILPGDDDSSACLCGLCRKSERYDEMNSMSQTLFVSPGSSFAGEITVPGDKSISHRALLFGALAEGITCIDGFLASEDTRATADSLRAMGVRIDEELEQLRVHGIGMSGLSAPPSPLWMGNSGTTTRLLMGILAGQDFSAILQGDASLQRRPMDRVAVPLQQMGATISGQGSRCTLPVTIQGGHIHGIHYDSPIASAQVKSAILLAGLFAEGETSVTEPEKSRDHTERMLRGFGVSVEEEGLTVRIRGGERLHGHSIQVPGDISSAAFFLVAGAITPGAAITVRHVGINPTRSGILDVLHAMGVDFILSDERLVSGEPIADIAVRHAPLIGTEIGGSLIPRLIDELPVLAVAAAFATGTTVIRDARELRVKESDRIASVCRLLGAMGANLEEREDGMVIHGGSPLHGATIECEGDHRIAMSAAVASIAAGVEDRIYNADTIATSFPTFSQLLRHLGATVREGMS